MATHATAFHVLARAAGLELTAEAKLPWLTRNGHFAAAVQQQAPAVTLTALDAILEALGGDAGALAAKTRGAMAADFLLTPGDTEVEYDELQHFTTARITTLELYPPHAALAFDPVAYRQIAVRWRARGDRGFAHKQAVEFPGPGRQRQRAYFDAFRDLTALHFGNGPVIRLAAPDNDYAAAVDSLKNVTDRLRASRPPGRAVSHR